MNADQAKKIVPSLAFLAVLADNSKDIYDVLCSLTWFALKSAKKSSFTREDAANIVNSCYGFDLPSVIINKAIKRMADLDYCVKGSKGYFSLNIAKINAEYEQILKDNKDTLDDYDYLASEMEKFSIEYGCSITRDEAYARLHTLVLNEIPDDSDQYSISGYLFMLQNDENERIKTITENINKGRVLYSCLDSDPQYSLLDNWQKELRLYLSTDVLFSAFGINGPLAKSYADYFLNLVKEFNSQKELISLHYFERTHEDYQAFFFAARQIISKGQAPDPTRPGMKNYLEGCFVLSDLVEKEASFHSMLKRWNIEQFDETNLDMSQYYLIDEITREKLINNLKDNDIKDIDQDIDKEGYFIERINCLRKGRNQGRFNRIGHFYLTNKTLTRCLAHHPAIKENERDIPLATNVDFLTEKLWLALNKGFTDKAAPPSFNMIANAKMALSTIIQEKVAERVNYYTRKIDSGELKPEQARELYASFANIAKKADAPESVDTRDIYTWLTERSAEDEIQHILEEKALLQGRAAKGEVALNRIKDIYEKELAEGKQKIERECIRRYKTVRAIFFLFFALIFLIGAYHVYAIYNMNEISIIIGLIGLSLTFCGVAPLTRAMDFASQKGSLWRWANRERQNNIARLAKELDKKYRI